MGLQLIGTAGSDAKCALAREHGAAHAINYAKEDFLARVKEIVGYYHIPCLQMDGFEADDIIGTIAKRAERDGYEVFCVTPDKDFLQLVSAE